RTIDRDNPDYRPFKGILSEIWQRYKRPLLIAETGAEGDLRGDWLRYVSEQAGLAMQRGVPVEGICLYPVLDYPGWTDERHCPTGLLGFPDENGNRKVHEGLADELRLQQMRFSQSALPRRLPKHCHERPGKAHAGENLVGAATQHAAGFSLALYPRPALAFRRLAGADHRCRQLCGGRAVRYEAAGGRHGPGRF